MQLPRMAKVKQRFSGPAVENIEQTVFEQLNSLNLAVQPGTRIAVTGGSRGINNIALILRSVIRWLRQQEAQPFIVPAMGSHGGATAEGQVAILAGLGVTEEYVEAPILSCMDVVKIGDTAAGHSVWMDKHCADADGVILVNRIKLHTDFRSDQGIESGLTKMAAIGMGKHQQAKEIHSQGVAGLEEVMPEIGRAVIESGHVLAGLAIIENAWEETAAIEAVVPPDIIAKDAELLAKSRDMMPKLPVEQLDILVVDALGKDYSGTGLDTNIIGRMRILGQPEPETPDIQYIIVSDVSPASKGNALGVGLADLTTRRLFDKINFQAMNENISTSTFLHRGMIPLVMENTKACVELALRCSWGVKPAEARIMRIPNTLHLDILEVSETLLPELQRRDDIEILEEPRGWSFDPSGYLLPLEE